MSGARVSVEEAEAFLAANPAVQWIDAFVFDMNGIPRGKRLRRSDLLGVVKHGLMMPSSIFIISDLAKDYGVFDFDNALFADMREERTADEQRQYFTYFISDHRPVWARFALKPAP